MKDKDYYEQVHHLQLTSTADNYFMYGWILAKEYKSVFEFGCNAGRHLKFLNDLGLEVSGCDLSKRAINAAQYLNNLPVVIGDEAHLKTLAKNSVDVCLTVSVLNHIEDIDSIVKQLKRIASKSVIVCESNTKTNENTKSPWYIHKYEDYGFKKVRSYLAKSQAIYTMYEAAGQ